MKLITIVILSTVFLATSTYAVEALTVGSKLPTLTLTTQHDKPAVIDAQTTQIIFSAEKQPADMLADFLDSKPATYLTNNHMLYLADIHNMPSLISKFIAIPKLKNKPYEIVLGREEADMAMLPREKGCLTLLAVNAQTVDAIQFICNENTLKNQLAP